MYFSQSTSILSHWTNKIETLKLFLLFEYIYLLHSNKCCKSITSAVYHLDNPCKVRIRMSLLYLVPVSFPSFYNYHDIVCYKFIFCWEIVLQIVLLYSNPAIWYIDNIYAWGVEAHLPQTSSALPPRLQPLLNLPFLIKKVLLKNQPFF